MKIKGEEYGFIYNIFARCEMDRMVKKSGYGNLGEMITQSYNRAIVCMSKGYEYAKAAADPAYKQKILTEEQILTLPAGDYAELDAEVNAAFAAGSERTVEEETPKGKNAKSTGKSS